MTKQKIMLLSLLLLSSLFLGNLSPPQVTAQSYSVDNISDKTITIDLSHGTYHTDYNNFIGKELRC